MQKYHQKRHGATGGAGIFTASEGSGRHVKVSPRCFIINELRQEGCRNAGAAHASGTGVDAVGDIAFNEIVKAASAVRQRPDRIVGNVCGSLNHVAQNRVVHKKTADVWAQSHFHGARECGDINNGLGLKAISTVWPESVLMTSDGL